MPGDAADLGAVISLRDFMATTGTLTRAQRQRIVDQALVLIEQTYVHLPLKRAMHAVDPVQRLKLLRYRLDTLTERRFHDEMLSIFVQLRDLHTNYVLPDPYRGKTAFLPFLLEEFDEGGEGGERRYMVSKMLAGFSDPHFQPGVIVTHWSGTPIDRAVDLNAANQAGSNLDARHARGLEALTVRPMGLSAPPDEEWIVVTYLDGDQTRDIQIEWRVFEPDPVPGGVDPDAGREPAASRLGIDALTEESRRAKKILFNRSAMEVERRIETLKASGDLDPAAGKVDGLDMAEVSTMPEALAFRTVQTPQGEFGLIRIWTFDVDDADAFVDEFVRIAKLLPQRGLIVDVRGNGGGLIPAGERLLQALTPRAIDPARLHFINTPLTLRLCERNDFIGEWEESIAQAVETGATFSQGFPLDLIERYNRLGQQYRGPVVLIIDALCYSTTDIFAAGFQDHAIGPILGTSGNTGAGGANVWSHALLRQFLPGTGSPFQTLPKGSSFRVAIRRTTRVGERSGVPLEDLGVVPEVVHRMTKNDLLNGNADLIAKAAELLAAQPVRTLDASLAPGSGGTATLTATTGNIARLDVFVDGRAWTTLDVTDGAHDYTIPAPPASAETLELRGYDDGTLVAARRSAL